MCNLRIYDSNHKKIASSTVIRFSLVSLIYEDQKKFSYIYSLRMNVENIQELRMKRSVNTTVTWLALLRFQEIYFEDYSTANE